MIHGIDTSFLVAAELAGHSKHQAARNAIATLVQAGDRFAVAPQVLAELVHVVTDRRRCSQPLSMATALQRAAQLWNAAEVVPVFPTAVAVSQFFAWMDQFQLGRKRLLDTQLAATYHVAGVHSLLTLNESDFAVFGCFVVHRV